MHLDISNITLKLLKILAWIIAGLIVLFVSLVLVIRSPSGQQFIINKATNYASGKTNTVVEIEKLYLTFDGNLMVKGVYLEDEKGDTLIYSELLEVSVALLPLIQGEIINVNYVNWSGLRASVNRTAPEGDFNFRFLINAFANADTTRVPTEPAENPATPSPQIKIVHVKLSDIDLSYDDEILGMKTSLQLAELNLEMEELDLENMIFGVDELIISRSNVNYLQYAALPTSEPSATDTSASPLPQIYINDLQINELAAVYESKPDSLLLDANIGHFNLALSLADLENQIIKLSEIGLSGSTIAFSDLSMAPADTNQVASTERLPFEWPNWEISVESIELDDNAFSLTTSSELSQKNVFDQSHIALSKLNLALSDLQYQPSKMAFDLQNISGTDRSGFAFNELAGKFSLNDEQIKIKDLIFETTNNQLEGNIQLAYPNIDVLMDGGVEQMNVSLLLESFSLNAKDAFYFAPELRNDPTVKSSTLSDLRGNVLLEGSLAQISLPKFEIQWGATKMNLQGTARYLLDSTLRFVDLPKIEISSTAKSIRRFLPSLDSATYIPEWLNLVGSFSGNPNQLNSQLSLKSALGNIEMELAYADTDSVVFNTSVKITELQLGKALDNSDLNNLSMTLKASGSGTTLNTLSGTIESDFQKVGYKNTDLRDLQLSGDINNGKATVLISYQDSILNASLQSVIILDTLSPRVELILDVQGAALAELGLTERDIRIKFLLKGSFEGTSESFDAALSLNDGLVVYDRNSYPFGALQTKVRVRNDSTNLKLTSDLLDIDLVSNTSPEELLAALGRQFQTYLGEPMASDTVSKPATMHMNFVLREDPLLDEILLESLQQFDSIFMSVVFDEASDSLTAHFLAPFIQYGESTLDSLKFDLVAGTQQADFSLTWTSITSGAITIGQTAFKGEVKNDTLFVDFLAIEESEKLFHVQSEISLNKDTTIFHVNPSELIFNKELWEIPSNNGIHLASNYVNFENFVLSNDQQELRLENTKNDEETDIIDLIFSNFKLSTFTSFFNSETGLVKGIISGNTSIIDPFRKTGLEADLKMTQLEVMGNKMGTLTLEGLSKDGSNYDFSLAVFGEPINLNLIGSYTALETGPEFELDFNLEKLKMSLVEGFSDGAIADASGSIAAEMRLSGSLDNPVYSGDFKFNDIGLTVTAVNSFFKLGNESLAIDNDGLHFEEFTIADASANTFRLDGDILTSSLINPTLDLRLDADNFQAVNAKKGENELFYGSVFLSADLAITGSVDIPVIRGDLSVNKGSDLTVMVPESQLSLVEREGVVVFVNKENPDEIITRSCGNETTADLTGIDLFANLSVDNYAVFRVLIDERSGDNFEVSGRGDFTIGLEPSGRTTLAGRYEVNSGHYKASLYGLVKREFSISPESVITWSGDPLGAQLDVTALYNIETSPAPLMATTTSSADASTTNKFNARLPFMVYLYVDGALLEPVISFGLGMPEAARGSLGGEVYGKVEQLNQDETALNKQVFSLLVLSRFFPASGSDGSSGGAEAIARNNVSKVLSGQLNAFSQKLLGETGFELNFGVNSYTADQTSTGESRTAVDVSASKKLFDERLIVQVGSEVGVEGSGQTTEEGTPLIGNVSLEYLLTENGRYRLKGYRKNEFTSIIDGQLIVTGIALIFNREFNKFKELFDETAGKADVSQTSNNSKK